MVNRRHMHLINLFAGEWLIALKSVIAFTIGLFCAFVHTKNHSKIENAKSKFN